MDGGKKRDVIVMGGGAAGLAAAAILARAGQSVLLLEARRRWGGRIWTRYPAGAQAPVELGPEFVHGRPPEIFRRAAAYRLPLVPVSGDWRVKRGAAGAGGETARGWDWEDQLARIAPPRPDQSFEAWLGRLDLTPEAREQARAFISGFHAADPERISLQSLIVEARAERALGGGRGFRLATGYQPLIAAMVAECRAAGVVMRLGAPVTGVRWRPGMVEVGTGHGGRGMGGAVDTARQAVITLPLPVLRGDPGAARVTFSPPLGMKSEAFSGLAMGQVERLVLCFRRRWWEGRRLGTAPAPAPAQTMGPFLFTPAAPFRALMAPFRASTAPFRAWWLAPAGAPQITAWAAGPGVAAWPHATAALRRQAAASLAAIFGIPKQHLVGEMSGAYRHDWRLDPWAAGAYTYALVGGSGAFAGLAEPVGGTLFFAGEATESQGHHATVHGALASGERAAREMLAR